MLRHVRATRYVTPLREGGSLPGVMEADDLGNYVVKFTGAGQGPKVLVAEVVCGRLAAALGLPVPELVTVEVAEVLGRAEPDPEIQQLLVTSAGLNLGMDFLPGSLDVDPAMTEVDPDFAAALLWFDALINNVDRSWRNPNLLLWHGRPYLIDHGSALTFHHHWATAAATAGRGYDAGDHVMAGRGGDVDAAHRRFAPQLTDELVTAVTEEIPQVWLSPEPGHESARALRRGYADWLTARLAAADAWLPGVRTAAATAPDRSPSATRRPDWLRPGGTGGVR